MRFFINKKFVKAGEVIQLKWNCPNAQNVKLSLSNGYNVMLQDVERKGIKKFKIPRFDKQITATLSYDLNGKEIVKHKILLKKPKLNPFKNTGFGQKNSSYSNGKASYGSYNGNKISNLWSKFKYGIKILPKEKKRLMTLFWAALLFSVAGSIFSPQISSLGLMLISVYILVILYKR